MNIIYTIKQDDSTTRQIKITDLWRLLKSYLTRGQTLTITTSEVGKGGELFETTITATKNS